MLTQEVQHEGDKDDLDDGIGARGARRRGTLRRCHRLIEGKPAWLQLKPTANGDYGLPGRTASAITLAASLLTG